MEIIAVISRRKEISRCFVDTLVGDMPIKDLDFVKNWPNIYEIGLKNGDIYKAYTFFGRESLRGLRFQKLYIHISIDDEETLAFLCSLCQGEVKFFHI